MFRKRKESPVKTQIPDAYLDLVNGPPVAALTTVMPDGQPQTTVVWCNFDGTHVLVNTMRGFRKEKNLRLNPKVTLLCYDPRQPLRSLEVRGTMEEHPHYYGSVYPVEQQAQETRIICRIHATKITLDAIHK
jgi:PPOX class probable F420-dependent enzyme